jgi:transcription antitermination protein NusB
MANRRLSRSIVLQTLFEWDSAETTPKIPELNKRLEANAKEFGAKKEDRPFMKQLLQNVIAKKKEIDTVIEKAAPEWPLDKIAVVDRNVLRVGLAELLYADKKEVPAKVAINEAIELAKSFGSDTSGKFVNGVLGAVYVEMGEPGKDDGPKNKKKGAIEKMPVEKLVGAIVYARDGENVYLALVHDIFGHWTLSKSKLGKGESNEDAIRRTIKIEVGLDVTEIKDHLGDNEYIANDPAIEGGKKRRHAEYFLVEAPFDELTLKKEGGLDDAQWFPLAKVGDLNFYDDILPVVTNAINILAQKEK